MSCKVVCMGNNEASSEGRTTSGGKCMRPGPVTTNGYLNYLREYRKKHCGLTAVETVRQGAAEWNKLSEQEKNKYTQMGCSIRRPSRSTSRSRRSAFAPRRLSGSTERRSRSRLGSNRTLRSRSRSRSASRSRRSASAPRSAARRSRRRRASAARGENLKSRQRSTSSRRTAAPRSHSYSPRELANSIARSRRGAVCHR